MNGGGLVRLIDAYFHQNPLSLRLTFNPVGHITECQAYGGGGIALQL
jgi:hypothetical protein